VMVGRGVVGKPWIARKIEAELAGALDAEPAMDERLDIALDHFRDSIAFYGDKLGLRMFRKHLAAYVEAAPWPAEAQVRREARARLCSIDEPAAVEAALIALWGPSPERLAA
ncbi:MAG: tRNA-dihydrouridine synthase, partial [Pseudomonadota bacterium]